MLGRMTRTFSTVVILFIFSSVGPGVGFSQAETACEYPSNPDISLEILTRLFAPQLLGKADLTDSGRRYCGVEITAMVTQTWSRMPSALRQEIPDRFRPPQFRTRGPTEFQDIEVCDAWLDTEHFRVHYSTQPEHLPPGYPDLQSVRELGSNLETAYAYHRDVSGVGVALPDGEVGGGQDLIDCYFYHLEEIFGWAQRQEFVEGYCVNSKWGYFAVSTDFRFRDFQDELKLTSEHEYFHLVQYAINPSQYSWFLESTARWSEFQVWPDIGGPVGAWQWMTHPYYSMWNGTGIHKYAPHFWFYLEANHGADFVTRLWERCCYMRGEDALPLELQARGGNLDDALTDFAVWNYFAGERDDGQHYDPAFNIPAVHHQAAHAEYPLPPVSLPADEVARPAGSNYIRFMGPASQNNLRIHLDGHPDMAGQRAVIALGVHDWGHRSWILAPDQNGDVEMIIPDWGLFDYVTLVVVNFWEAPHDDAALVYTYAAEEVSQSFDAATPASLVKTFPNPFQNSTRVLFNTPRDGSACTVRIFDMAGRLVRTLFEDAVYSGLHQVLWDGKDENGKQASAGVYLVRLDSGSQTHTDKVMFVR